MQEAEASLHSRGHEEDALPAKAVEDSTAQNVACAISSSCNSGRVASPEPGSGADLVFFQGCHRLFSASHPPTFPRGPTSGCSAAQEVPTSESLSLL